MPQRRPLCARAGCGRQRGSAQVLPELPSLGRSAAPTELDMHRPETMHSCGRTRRTSARSVMPQSAQEKSFHARPLLDPSAMRTVTWPSCSAFQCIPSKKPAVSNAALCSVRRAVRHGKIAKEGSFSLLNSPEHSQYKQGKDEKCSPAAEELPRHRCHVWPWQAWCHRPAQSESPVTSDLRPSSDTSLIALLDIA